MPAVSREHHSHAVCSNNKAVREEGTQGAAPELSCTIKLSTGSWDLAHSGACSTLVSPAAAAAAAAAAVGQWSKPRREQ